MISVSTRFCDLHNAIIATVNTLNQHDFTNTLINISLGPDIPIDDHEINRWTSSLDTRLVGGKAIVTVAAGNDGESDDIAGLNRIQPPSDAVNLLSIGSSDKNGKQWSRASYSCVGPGRSPGIVKPDAVIFGGSDDRPFYVVGLGSTPSLVGLTGTSFASPHALRTAVAVRAQLGADLRPLVLRALLIHRAELENASMKEVGWGRLESDLDRIITCEDNESLVLFQGQLPIGQYLRTPIPLPDILDGDEDAKIKITATLIISPEVNPGYPNIYTRGGLEIVFRPDSTNFRTNKNGVKSKHPISMPFFSKKNLYKASEYILRSNGHKWETTQKANAEFNLNELNNPFFDIYYHHREKPSDLIPSSPIVYALVISLLSPDIPDLYDRVVRTYSHQLVQLRPQNRLTIHKKL